MGSGTTAVAAAKLERNYIGFEANPEFHGKAKERIEEAVPRNAEALFPLQKTLFESNG